MATIIQTSPTSFIAGDPADHLKADEHWCGYCSGDGLEYDYTDELVICGGCDGRGVVNCVDPECPDHTR